MTGFSDKQLEAMAPIAARPSAIPIVFISPSSTGPQWRRSPHGPKPPPTRRRGTAGRVTGGVAASVAAGVGGLALVVEAHPEAAVDAARRLPDQRRAARRPLLAHARRVRDERPLHLAHGHAG